MEKLAVAYSGGVDSSFLLHTACTRLSGLKSPEIDIVAVTLDTGLNSIKEIETAKKNIENTGIKHLVLDVDILSIDKFSQNPPDRCYICKMELFLKIKKFAKENNIEHIAEGSNYDDDNDYRPGIRALKELGIRSPLQEAGLGKQEIRILSKKMGLSTWNRPAIPCLATRIPYGNKITKEGLLQIELAEDFIHKIGIDNLRVRAHGDIARIEVQKNEIKMLINKNISQKIINRFKELGFTYITLDIEGYRMGRMNEMIRKENKIGQE